MSDTVKEQLFEEDNDLARSNCDKLYLDPTTADVNFVFGEGIDSVTAHKILLACVSTVFHRMFYGSLPEKGDIVIEDASRNAFKEFLQFFYLSKVRLSSEHIFQVVNLCKKYEMADALKRCEAPMQKSLKINNMCTGYSVALLLEMKNVIEFCEREIKEKPTEVLKSTNFLDCDHKLLDKILQLVSSKCSASAIVDACMAWAKAECEHKNVRISPASLKIQLKDSLERIPFAELTKGQFAEFIAAYNGFFLKKDLEEIILEVMSKKAKANVPAPQPLYVLDCDRRLKNKAHVYVRLTMPNFSSFDTNARLLLTEFYVAKASLPKALLALARLSTRGKELSGTVLNLIPDKTTHVVLPNPIIIDPKVAYNLTIEGSGNIGFKKKPLANQIKMRDGIEINFLSSNSIITRLVFQQIIGY